MPFFAFLTFLTFITFPAASVKAPIHPDPLRGIYLTSHTVSSSRSEKIMDEFKKLGGNMVIFDVQDASGRLAYPSQLSLSWELENRKDQIKDLQATVDMLHRKGFYAVARFVLFKNGFLVRKKREWVLKRKKSQAIFASREGAIWLDAGHQELQQYLIDIAREVAASGVDEIQFDYVRFPGGGRGGTIGYAYTGDEIFSPDQAITNFISELSDILHAMEVKLSVDIFGIVVWDDVSWRVIGQNIGELGKYVDAIYPMPYPSHFGPGWGGHRNPADEPYFFVQESVKKFLEQTKHTKVKIRPWLQGFAMRVRHYNSVYIQQQIRAINDIGLQEFSIWNAMNNYGISFKGLENMQNKK